MVVVVWKKTGNDASQGSIDSLPATMPGLEGISVSYKAPSRHGSKDACDTKTSPGQSQPVTTHTKTHCNSSSATRSGDSVVEKLNFEGHDEEIEERRTDAAPAAGRSQISGSASGQGQRNPNLGHTRHSSLEKIREPHSRHSSFDQGQIRYAKTPCQDQFQNDHSYEAGTKQDLGQIGPSDMTEPLPIEKGEAEIDDKNQPEFQGHLLDQDERQYDNDDTEQGDYLTPNQSPQPRRTASSPAVVSMDMDRQKVALVLQDEDYDEDFFKITGHKSQSPLSDSSEIVTFSSRNERESVNFQNNTSSAGSSANSNYDPSDPLLQSPHSFLSERDDIYRGGRRTPTYGQSSDGYRGAKITSDKKKKGYWHNPSLVLSPTYKSRSEEFKRIFKDIPNEERLIVEYSCALQKDILVHGRIYITQNYICFYANIFRWETVLMIKCKDITSITKEKTARVIPNAIQISTKDEKYFFTSFGTRDKTYLMLFRVWQNALTGLVMSTQEIYQWVRYSYGEELGLASSDEEYISPSQEEELQFQSRIQQEEKMVAQTEGVGVCDKEPDDSLNDSIINGELSPLSVPVCLDNPVVEGSFTSRNGTLEGKRPQKLDIPGSPAKSRTLKVPGQNATSADISTDLGDTSEDDEALEAMCTDHDHLDISCVDEVFNFSVDRLFELIFTDSQLYKDFTIAKKTFDVVLSPWSEVPDENGNRLRNISYTLSLNYSIGPKSSPSTERQVMFPSSKPGICYFIETECYNQGIPYGDNFFVLNRICLLRVSSQKSRLKITSAIKYKKSVWGLVKNFIDKNATSGILESFSILADILRQESNRQAQLQLAAGQPAGKKKVFRRRRNVSDRSISGKRASGDMPLGTAPATPIKTHPPKSKLGQATKEEWYYKLTADTLVRLICAVLIILVVFNAVLFYKLLSLENKSAIFSEISHKELLRNAQESPKTQDEWLHLLEKQQALHNAELERWRSVLSSSVQLMEKMKQTLLELEHSIDHRSSFLRDQFQDIPGDPEKELSREEKYRQNHYHGEH